MLRLKNNSGFLLMETIVAMFLAAGAVVGIMKASDATTHLKKYFTTTSVKTDMLLARDYLVQSATFANGPGGNHYVLLAPTGTTIPVSIPVNNVDQYGSAYTYCAWDLSKGNTNPAYSMNAVNPPIPDGVNYILARIVSSGPDKTLQTACGDAVGQGDDIVLDIYESTVLSSNGGFGGWKYSVASGYVSLLNPAAKISAGGSAVPTHQLELPGGTTAAEGLAMGDVELFRSAANTLQANVAGGYLNLNGGGLRVSGTAVLDTSRNLTANNITASGGSITLNNAVSNNINFGSTGVAAPTLTTRSAGTKLVLYSAVSGANVDYAIGIEGNSQWYSVANAVNNHFKWYAGTTMIMDLHSGAYLGLGKAANTSYSIDAVGNINAAGYYLNGVALPQVDSGTVAGQTLFWNGTKWAATSGVTFNSGTGVLNIAAGGLSVAGSGVIDGTGKWTGTTISVDKGGTGLTNYAIGDLLYASGAASLSRLGAGAAGFVLTSNGPGTAPSWQVSQGWFADAGQNLKAGFESMKNATTAGYNISAGYQAMGSGVATAATGYNTALNYQALYSLTSGTNNQGIGYRSLYNTNSGSNNAGYGANSGLTNTTGSNNTFLGASADTSVNNLTYATAVGSGALVSASNTVVLGRTTDSVAIGTTAAATGKLYVSNSASGVVTVFNTGAGNYASNEFAVNGIAKGSFAWNSNDSNSGAGTAMVLYNFQGKQHIYDSTGTGITVSGGNVGVGERTPGEKMEISTVGTATNLMLKLNADTNKYSQLGYYTNGVLKWNIYNDFGNDNLVFGNSAGPKIHVTQAGSMGFGTGAPSRKLTMDLGFSRDGIMIISEGDANAYSDIDFVTKTPGGLAAGQSQSYSISHRKDGFFSGGAGTGPSLEFYAGRKGGGYYAPLAFKGNGDVIINSQNSATPGKVGVATSTPSAVLEIGSVAGVNYSGAGWLNSLKLPNVGAIHWGMGPTYSYSIGQSGDGLYFGMSTSEAVAGSITYPLVIDNAGVLANQMYTSGWFRNNVSGTGLFHQIHQTYFYADNNNYWSVANNSGGSTGIVLRNGYAGAVWGYYYADANASGLLAGSNGSWNYRILHGGKSDGTYGAATIYGDKNGYAGVAFRAANGNMMGTLMISTDHSGFYNANDNGWRFYAYDSGNIYGGPTGTLTAPNGIYGALYN